MKHKMIILLLTAILFSCDRSYTPKPDGYIKVHYPEKSYTLYDQDGPYNFEYPVYSHVFVNKRKNSEPYWYDIFFPEYRSTIHLSYKAVNNNVDTYINDSRTLVYKHTSRSDGIDEVPFIDTQNARYGILYDLKGNVASSVQFFITDSVHHFVRGSLYFNTSPNRDSLNPIINYLREDIEHLIESIEWK